MTTNEAGQAANTWIGFLQNNSNHLADCYQKTPAELRAMIQQVCQLVSVPTAEDVGKMRDYAVANKQADLDALHAQDVNVVNGCLQTGS